MELTDKLLGTYTSENKRKYKNLVNEVLTRQKQIKSVKNLKDYTVRFKKSLSSGKMTESMLVDALAVCCEAVFRTKGHTIYPTQIEAAIAMYDGTVAEMKTGEGKTYVQVLVGYLRALEGKGVHIITANEYLASRDESQNRSIFNELGINTSYIKKTREDLDKTVEELKRRAQSDDRIKSLIDRKLLLATARQLIRAQKRKKYDCDIVYATASTLAFDYLDDNRVSHASERAQTKKFGYAIIDEVDSILLDDALTPLIITGNAPDSVKSDKTKDENAALYGWATDLVSSISCKVVDKDLRRRDEVVKFSEACMLFKDTMEVEFNDELIKKIFDGKKFDPQNLEKQEEYNRKLTAVKNCILARYYYTKDIHYVVSNNQVKVVDQNIGRVLEGRRFGGGIHEALEAKEKLKIKNPVVTTGMCTYPDFFGKYKGVSGMTGTSDSKEFEDLYHMPTYEVDTRKPNIRKDRKSSLFASGKAKHQAILKEILRCRNKLQPVLIGTSSIKESEELSKLLSSSGIRHQLLNAKNDKLESSIIENAGNKGMVTIATNMAGRGTDIKLGPGVRELGGLYVISSGRNKNRRIDNQLRGRSARQGDPGETKYFESLDEDMVVRRDSGVSSKLRSKTSGLKEIKNKLMKSLVDKCQRSQELYEKRMRLNNEKYSSVMVEHRTHMYDQRDKIVDSENISTILGGIISSYAKTLSETCSLDVIKVKLGHLMNFDNCESLSSKELYKVINDSLIGNLKKLSTIKGYEGYTRKRVLDTVDTFWIDHLLYLEEERKNSTYSSLAGKDPFEEYKRRADLRFIEMTEYIQNEIITYALAPNMKFGSYEVKEYIEPEESKKR